MIIYTVCKSTGNVLCEDNENKGNTQNVEPCDNIRMCSITEVFQGYKVRRLYIYLGDKKFKIP